MHGKLLEPATPFRAARPRMQQSGGAKVAMLR
ncbi:hypothetical protein ACFDR9_005625 [Janthinobacterium sp. CG_23.3]